MAARVGRPRAAAKPPSHSAAASAFEVPHEAFEAEDVTVAAEPAHFADARAGDSRSPAEDFTRLGVRQVHLDAGEADGREGVKKGYRGVRESGCVQEDAFVGTPRSAEPVEDDPLMVGLLRVHVHTELRSARCDSLVDLREGRLSVNGRLTRSQELKVRPRDAQDSIHELGDPHWMTTPSIELRR